MKPGIEICDKDLETVQGLFLQFFGFVYDQLKKFLYNIENIIF